MHHKRKRSSTRAELKRMDNKSYRQQEARALDAPDSKTGSSRVHRWGYRPEPLPINDLPCTGNRQGKRKTKPKKPKLGPKCRHEWYEEIVVEDHFFTECTNPNCPHRRRRYYNLCAGCWDSRKLIWLRGPKQYYKITKRQATCINCWEVRVYEEIDSRLDPNLRRHSWRGRKRLKRRTQDLAAGMTVSVR